MALDKNDPEDARELAFLALKEQADKGDAKAQYQVASCYLSGIGIAKSNDFTKKYLLEAAANGNLQAQYEVGMAYDFGFIDFPHDCQKAEYYYKLAADQGGAAAFACLGDFFYYGINQEFSKEKAFTYYKKAVELGDSYSLGLLGHCYEKGIGVEVSEVKAEEFYRLYGNTLSDDVFSDLQIENSQLKKYISSVSHNESQLLQRCQKKEFIQHRSRAALGNTESQFITGIHYLSEFEGDKKAYHFFQLAGEKKHPIAIRWLGYLLECGRGVEQSIEKAISCYEKAANLGDAVASAFLGYCYERGSGVSQSLEQAKHFYELSVKRFEDKEFSLDRSLAMQFDEERFAYNKAYAFLGDSKAHENLAICYRYGKGTSRSEALYRLHLELSGKLGNTEALFTLGNKYDLEDGAFEKAIHYYQMAAEKGHAMANAFLGYFYEFGLGIPQSIEKAIYCYEQASGQNDIMGLRALSYCYEKGKGIPKSRQKAEYYRDLINKTDENALQNRINEIIKESYMIYASLLFGNAKSDSGEYLCRAAILHRGIDADRSDRKSLYFYRLAAEQGNKTAQFLIPLLFPGERVPEQTECPFRQKRILKFFESAFEESMIQGRVEDEQKSVNISTTQRGDIAIFIDPFDVESIEKGKIYFQTFLYANSRSIFLGCYNKKNNEATYEFHLTPEFDGIVHKRLESKDPTEIIINEDSVTKFRFTQPMFEKELETWKLAISYYYSSD
jgi:TPR repeat protein